MHYFSQKDNFLQINIGWHWILMRDAGESHLPRKMIFHSFYSQSYSTCAQGSGKGDYVLLTDTLCSAHFDEHIEHILLKGSSMVVCLQLSWTSVKY